MSLENNLKFSAFFLWGMGASMLFSHVMDMEPRHMGDEYSMEKEIYERDRDGDWNADFPTFAEWCENEENGEGRFLDFVGYQAASCFDNSGDFNGSHSGDRQDTSSGQGGAAPENCMQGEE